MKKDFATSGPVWDDHFPKIKVWTISSMVVIILSFVILNYVCPLYSDEIWSWGQGFLGVFQAIILGLSVVSVLAVLIFRDRNRVTVPTVIMVINSLIAIWQTFDFWKQAGDHFRYSEKQAFPVLIMETVILVVCCIMELLSYKEIVAIAEENEET